MQRTNLDIETFTSIREGSDDEEQNLRALDNGDNSNLSLETAIMPERERGEREGIFCETAR